MAAASLATDDPVLAAFADEVGRDDPVAVEGARTRWDLGGRPSPGVRLVRAPTGIVDHQPEEMTVTVRAGTPVAELHAVLAERGQRTALPERGGTVGGALAAGENDIRALGRGLVRTALLQVRYVSADGRLVTGGGPTVKNVSGFDLPRLLVSSLGTLGLLAEAILRTNPIPAVSRWLMADDADPLAVHQRLLDPAAVLWDGTSTWVELEGHESDVDAERASLADLGSFRPVEAPVGGGVPPDLPPHRWSLPPAELRHLAPAAGTPAGGDEARRCLPTGPFLASVGVGTVWAPDPAPERTVPAGVAAVARRLKANFDPTDRLAPGRSLGRS
jgi:glycolate oxidase FAD binding subunit